MRGNWDKVNQAIRRALEDVSLADMAAVPLAWPRVHAAGRCAAAAHSRRMTAARAETEFA